MVAAVGGWNAGPVPQHAVERTVPNQRVHDHAALAHVGRAARRALAPTGEVSRQLPDYHGQAVVAAQTLDAMIPGNQFLVWLDNWCWLRYTTDPAIPNLSQNLSVIALLPLDEAVGRAPAGRLRATAVPVFGGHLDLITMVRMLDAVVALTNDSVHALHGKVLNVLRCGLRHDVMRVPLDVQRQNMVSLQWRPYLLSGLVVSANLDLLKLMRIIEALQVRTTQTMPLLVDENIHYRLLRLLHGQDVMRFNVAGWMRHIPLLFGIWHGYKHTLLVLYRAFFPIFALLECAAVPVVGQAPRSERKVLYLEKLFGAMLLAGQVVLPMIQARLRQLQEEHRERVAALRNLDPNRICECDEDIRAFPPHVHMSLQQLLGLRNLLEHYLPLMFSLGYRVRTCAWEGRADGTVKGIVAKGVLQHCFLTQLHLLQDWTCKAEYTKTMACALLAWKPDYSRMPGCLFVEESCEAMLSRLASRVRAHPHLSSFRQTLDLFLTLPRARSVARGTRGGIRLGLVTTLVDRMRVPVQRAGDVPFARLKSARVAEWERTFPDGFHFPDVIPAAFPRESLAGVFKYAVVHMTGSRQLNAEVMQWMEASLPRRGHEDCLKHESALNAVGVWRKERRVRPVRQAAPVHQPVGDARGGVPVDGEDLYEPPGDDLSAGYVSYGDTSSLGSNGDLVDLDEDLSMENVQPSCSNNPILYNPSVVYF